MNATWPMHKALLSILFFAAIALAPLLLLNYIFYSNSFLYLAAAALSILIFKKWGIAFNEPRMALNLQVLFALLIVFSFVLALFI
jgi:hypothetical protein